ncbi:MAG: peroxide stress protein YaaA [Chloroflexota bacterium]
MKIILIPCSGSKAPGGQSNSQPSKLADTLSPTAFQKLMSARQKIEAILHEEQNPGLGFKDHAGDRKYLPAYQRYQGIIYARSGISRLYPAFKGRLVIVSALYGLLDGSDLISDYNLSMKDTLLTRTKDTLPTRMKVHTFWRRHELREILIELIGWEGAAEVHDLLSGPYREALRPWPDSRFKNLHPYEYPGMGQGSSYERAKDLKRLLSQ